MHPVSQYNPEYTDYNEFYEYTEELTPTDVPTEEVHTDTKVNTAQLYGPGARQSLSRFLYSTHFHSLWTMIYKSVMLPSVAFTHDITLMTQVSNLMKSMCAWNVMLCKSQNLG